MNKFFVPVNYEHIKKFFGFFSGSLFAIFFAYWTTFLLNDFLSKKDMGMYSYIFNVLNLAYPVISLCASSGYIRFISIYQNEQLIGFVRKVSFFSTMLFILVILLWFNNWYYLFFAFIILYQERLILARATLEIKKYNFLNIIQKVIFLLFLFYMRNNLTAELALLLLGASYLISYLIVQWIWEKEEVHNEVLEEIEKSVFLKFCTVTVLTTIVHWLLTVSDQVIIKFYYGYTALAPYAVAYRIVTMLGLVSGIFLSYYPSVYFKEITTKNVIEIFLLRRYFIIILMFATLGLLFFKDVLYVILGASDYRHESGYFTPLLLGETCRIIASVLMTFLTFKLRQTKILVSMLFISILNIILNIVFVPYYGPIAAAYCTLVCFILYLALAFVISYIPEWRYVKNLYELNVNNSFS